MLVLPDRAAVVTARPVSGRVSKPWLGAIGTGPCPGASATPGLGRGHRQMRRDALRGIWRRRGHAEGDSASNRRIPQFC